MPYTYVLLVDQNEKFSGTFSDAHALAADAISRASEFADIDVTAEDLASDVSKGFAGIDLRLQPPEITVLIGNA